MRIQILEEVMRLIKATGYGETKALISDEEIAKLIPKSPEFESAHQKNRRTAFKVTGEGTLKINSK